MERDEDFLDRVHRRGDPAAWSSESRGGMVATAHYRATRIAAAVLRRGGTAVDAAAAASFALGVCEPVGSGLGGMTVMLVHLAASRRTFVIEGPCRAPRQATPEAVAGTSRKHGPRCIAVPGTVALIAHALREHGSFRPGDLILPASDLAIAGYPVSELQRMLAEQYRIQLQIYPGGRLFLDRDGRPFPAGKVFRQPELARTLCRLSGSGLEDFYRGAISRQIVEDMETRGGFLRREDLEDIPWPAERAPLTLRCGGWEFVAPAPPGGGVALLEMLRLFFELPLPKRDPDTPRGACVLAEVIRRARLDRRQHAMRLARGNEEAVAELLDPDRAKIQAARILANVEGEGETTHVSVMDRWGNVVAMTQSLERCFGSKVVTPSLGFLYNGYLRAFKVQNPSHPHFLRPGAVARSNACPVIVFRNGAPFAALGSTGSERMASGIFLVLARLILGRTPFQAVQAPRFHCTPEGVVQIEADRFPAETIKALQRGGRTIQYLTDYSFALGGLQLVTREADGKLCGVADPRRDGAAESP